MPVVSPMASVHVRATDEVAQAPLAQRSGAAIAQASFHAALTRAATPGTRSVEPEHTQLGGDEAASALSRAFESVTGRAPTAKQLSLLTAQWSLETGGGKAMMNYNFGGLK